MNLTASGNRRRVLFLDELRGLCVLLMILYHGLYDLVAMFGVNLPFQSLPFRILQLFICCNFIFISGISSRFSRSNLKRGLLVFAVAMVMTIGTWIAMPDFVIRFGVLHLLGCCMMLHGAIFRDGVGKLSGFWGMVLFLALFAMTYGIPQGFVGFFGIPVIRLPGLLYQFSFGFPLGLPSPGFTSSDYFPLLPWACLFFAGSYLGIAFREGSMPSFFYKSRSRFLQAVGRHALVIYVLHQPVLYGLLTGFFALARLLGFTG